MPRRGVTILGLTVVGAGGYYLYQAGGDPKVAERKAEHDAARVSTSIKDRLPGREKEVKTEAKVLGEQAGAKIDSAYDAARSRAAEAESRVSGYASDASKRLEHARQETGKTLNNAVDKFDRSVEQGAAKIQEEATKAKGGISSWFGGK
ncbi:hypothetical protein K461DRAFT_291885 [Myriangium duriaei CBS 260.36]|uniref:Calcofluor white hypersensitive protein n=1 Tax=Myriangium duriaei CBS 260.36 TaxID=1168546 RepID=A0A9P4J5J6_9PEZI|nr:hypothetical protein K461DRAFT_291885 [Myriangium duriaei CBS 260.36]